MFLLLYGKSLIQELCDSNGESDYSGFIPYSVWTKIFGCNKINNMILIHANLLYYGYDV